MEMRVLCMFTFNRVNRVVQFILYASFHFCIQNHRLFPLFPISTLPFSPFFFSTSTTIGYFNRCSCCYSYLFNFDCVCECKHLKLNIWIDWVAWMPSEYYTYVKSAAFQSLHELDIALWYECGWTLFIGDWEVGNSEIRWKYNYRTGSNNNNTVNIFFNVSTFCSTHSTVDMTREKKKKKQRVRTKRTNK